MNKKLFIIGGIVLGLLLILGGGFIFFNSKSKSDTIPQSSAPTPTTAPILTTWDDPIGFTFQYPEDLTVDKHDEDKENYAHVELTSSAHPGSITVWAKDLPTAKSGKVITDAATWVKEEKTFSEGSILDTILGGEEAKKVLLEAPESKVIVGTFYDDLLFMIEINPIDKEYWQGTSDALLSSFVFKKPTPEAAGTSEDSGAEESFDEEEVIE